MGGKPGLSCFNFSIDLAPPSLTLWRIISAGSYFSHGSATQPLSVTHYSSTKHLNLFLFFLSMHDRVVEQSQFAFSVVEGQKTFFHSNFGKVMTLCLDSNQ